MCAACEAAGRDGYAPDLTADFHAHTAFSGGRDAVGVVVTAAERAGLRQLVIGDRAGAGTTWLPAYQSAIARAQRRTDVQLRVAIEVEVVRADGWLDLPADLTGLELVSVALSRVPLPTGPAAPQQVRALLRSGDLRPADVTELGGLIKAVPAGPVKAAAQQVIADAWAQAKRQIAGPPTP